MKGLKGFRIAGIAALLAWFAASVLLEDLIIAGMIALGIFAALIILDKTSVKRKAKKQARIVEKDLPFALLSMSVELSYNTDFEKVLENAARQEYGLFSKGLKKVLGEVKAGASVQEALAEFGKSFESTQLKRAVNQLISAFEQGSRKHSGENLKKLGQEMLARQRIESKEFNSKLALYSLMFVSLSAVMPALFQAFVIVGSSFLELDFSALQIIAIATVLFPALNLAVLFFARNSMPEFLK